MPRSLQTEALELAQRKVAQGFDSDAEIESSIAEMLSDEHDDVAAIAAAAQVAVRQARAEHQLAMSSWPAVTDCDRLDAAFEELNAAGIMARHDWTCCGTCGAAEMPQEFDRLGGKWEGKPIIGYTFYHQQDTENAVECDGLYLGYGSTEQSVTQEEYDRRAVAIAHRVCQTLQRHGIRTEWDGSINRRIAVELLWQRRARPRRFCGDRPDLG